MIATQSLRPRRPGELYGFKILSSDNGGDIDLEEILMRGGVELNDMPAPAARGVTDALASAGGSSAVAVGGRGRGWRVDIGSRF